jgi:pimeloyl-ACP methyl ester carboxylesterase
MQTSTIYTPLKARLRLVKSNIAKPYNWIFLPGGPGLGSESLALLTNGLDLPGSMWHLDLPNDGSNVLDDSDSYFEHWPAALIEAVKTLDRVILVAHSTGGMYALATPPLKEILHGFVIMDSAPDASWQASFMRYVNQHPLSEAQRLQTIYGAHPTNEHLKQLTIASLPYLVAADKISSVTSFFEHLPYNVKACEWSAQHFDQTYKSQWVPDAIPTLIFAGDQDHITPLDLFVQARKFHHENIVLETIDQAGHYPWIENMGQVALVFKEFCKRLP